MRDRSTTWILWILGQACKFKEDDIKKWEAGLGIGRMVPGGPNEWNERVWKEGNVTEVAGDWPYFPLKRLCYGYIYIPYVSVYIPFKETPVDLILPPGLIPNWSGSTSRAEVERHFFGGDFGSGEGCLRLWSANFCLGLVRFVRWFCAYEWLCCYRMVI